MKGVGVVRERGAFFYAMDDSERREAELRELRELMEGVTDADGGLRRRTCNVVRVGPDRRLRQVPRMRRIG